MQYNDATGRQFHSRLTIGTVRDLREKTGRDLLRLDDGDPPLIQRLFDDPVTLGEILEHLLREPFKSHGVDPDEWLTDNLMHLRVPFMEDIADFFLRCGLPQNAAAIQAATEIFEKANEALESLNGSYINSPGSSESTQVHSQSAS